jgi:hypothetical protein
MKHVIADDINVNVKIDIPADDLEQVIDKVTDAAVTIIIVATGAHIFKRLLRGE